MIYCQDDIRRRAAFLDTIDVIGRAKIFKATITDLETTVQNSKERLEEGLRVILSLQQQRKTREEELHAIDLELGKANGRMLNAEACRCKYDKSVWDLFNSEERYQKAIDALEWSMTT